MTRQKERIFISYKRIDKERVFAIKDGIEQATGEKCWIDLDGIESDAQFANVIIKAINQCEVFLFMYSKEHANIIDFDTDWTIREINFAQKKRRRIVFVNIDNTPLADWFEMMFGTKQQIDATDPAKLIRLHKDLCTWLKIDVSQKEDVQDSIVEDEQNSPHIAEQYKVESEDKINIVQHNPNQLEEKGGINVSEESLVLEPKDGASFEAVKTTQESGKNPYRTKKTIGFISIVIAIIAIVCFNVGAKMHKTLQYEYNHELKTATVVRKQSKIKLIGNIKIPRNTKHRGKTYRVNTIDSRAFKDYGSLVSITIPSSVTNIGEQAFESCYNLASVNIPSSILMIGDMAFYRCSSLTSVTISGQVRIIGNGTFKYCTHLESVVIPKSVTTIGKDAFSGCSSLRKIRYTGTREQWLSIKRITVGTLQFQLTALFAPTAV